jgi:hypothetical protein
MRCGKFRRQIALYAGGDLDPGRVPALEDHLKRCPACSAEFESLKHSLATVRNIHRADTPEPLPEDFALAVHGRIAESASTERGPVPGRFKRLVGKPALIAAGFLIAFGLGFGFSWKLFPGNGGLTGEDRMAVRAAFEELHSALSEDLPYRVIGGASFREKGKLPRQAGVYLVVYKTGQTKKAHAYTVAYHGESRNLRSLYRYPWIRQREKELIQRAGSPDNVIVIICPMPESSRKARKNVSRLLAARLGSS